MFSKEKSIDNVITLEGLPFNSSMKNWDVCLVLLEISWWIQINEMCFVSFGLMMWEI